MTAHQHHADPAAEEAAQADLLDLDAEVLHAYLADAISWLRQESGTIRRARILDLGAGTGTGTVALAQRFGGAKVIAVDAAAPMLHRVRARALDLGLAPRVRTVEADLDAGLPDVGTVDVGWASMSLHHLTDPDRVLGQVFAALRPGGLLAVAEFGAHLRFLPDDLGFGRPGLEQRCHNAFQHAHDEALPHLGSDWTLRLEHAGFTQVRERAFTIALDPPHPPGTRRYALTWLRRMRSAIADRLASDDLGTLDELLDGGGPRSLAERADLQVRGVRTVSLARRP